MAPLCLGFGFVVSASAQSCTNANYQGTYYIVYSGTVGGGQPFFEFEQNIADGKGGLTSTVLANSTGQSVGQTVSGTYTVNPDCSGTHNVVRSAAFQLVAGGKRKLEGVSAAGDVLSGEAYRAAANCTVGGLSGEYGLLINYGIVGNVVFTEAGSMTFDGKGGFTFVESENGTIYRGSGSYTVKSDCSGTASMVFTGTTYHVAAALVEGGKILLADNDPGEGFFGVLEPVSNRFVLPQLAFGGSWYSAIYFNNTNNYPVSFPVNFFADDSTPLNVPGTGSSASVNLAAQASSIIEAPDSGSLVQGYASVPLPPGVQAYAVFRQSVSGVPDQEAVAPLANALSTQATLAFDDTNYTTAVAIVNPSNTANTVSISVVDNTGAVIGAGSVNLIANGKTEAVLRNLTGLSGIAGKRGVATFSVTSGAVAVLGLRFNGTAFTSIPAISN
ncbi:MAG TPA: hypothetical protein VKS01_02750 [Bryobacteraceae bacterium]|nr:hypothetical protein [Bryobacteraceae bacterium]